MCMRVCVCICLGCRQVLVGHRCTVGDVTLHIDFTVSDHHAIYLEKCFSMVHLQRRLWRNLCRHEYVDEYPGEGRESFTAPTTAFYIRQGQKWWSEGKRQREGGNEEKEKDTEGGKVNGSLFSHEVHFLVSTGQLSLFPTVCRNSIVNMARIRSYLPVCIL